MSLSKKKTELQKLKNLPKTRDKTELKLAWHRNAVIRHWMGESASSIAKVFNRSESIVYDLMQSPAAKELKDYLDKKLGDPADFAKELAKANSLDVTLDWYMALEWAKEARDYDAVAKMSKDLAALGGVQATPPKQEVETTKTITIHFDGSDLNQQTVEAEWEEIVDDDSEDP